MNQDDTYLNTHEKEYVEILRKPGVQFKQNNQTQSKVTMIETVNEYIVRNIPSTNQDISAGTKEDVNIEIKEKMTKLENIFKNKLK